MSVTFIDLFCGVGGIRLGMEKAGFNCVMSCDINEECRKTYFENFSEMPLGDITKIKNNVIPNHDILCAGFPCQPFSISGRQQGFNDVRGMLFFEICRVFAEKRPTVIFLENVKHLVHHNCGKTLNVILSTLEKHGYTVAWKILNAKDFGTPQNRERILIVGSLYGKFDFTKVKTELRLN